MGAGARALPRRGARRVPRASRATSAARSRIWPPRSARPNARDDDDDRGGHARVARRNTATRIEPSPPPRASIPSRASCSAQRPGHCELFASAAVLLLRVRGRSRALRDRVPRRRMERRRRLRRRPRRSRPRLGGSLRARRGWVRVDATPPGPPPPRAGQLSAGHGCARLLLEPLGRRLRPGPPAGARAPRGSPPGGAAPRTRRARASCRSSSPRCAAAACWCWSRAGCGGGARTPCATRTT